MSSGGPYATTEPPSLTLNIRTRLCAMAQKISPFAFLPMELRPAKDNGQEGLIRRGDKHRKRACQNGQRRFTGDAAHRRDR
jgi:hypothetical protein